MKRIAILGLGLMGASLAVALRARRAAHEVVAYARRPATRREALRRRVCDRVHADPAEAVWGAEVVVCCVPVLAIPELVQACRSGLGPGCVVTDVGSTKAWLARVMPVALRGSGAVFVGSHPIAGSDETGIGALRATLYQDAIVVVTPGRASAGAVARVERLWQGVGGRVVRLSPARHDAVMARTSHLPHVMAAVLVHSVLQAKSGMGRFCGSGFRDTTRVAGGSEDVWHDIVRTNRDQLLRALDDFGRRLAALRHQVAARDFAGIRRFLAQARVARRSWDARRS